MLDASDDAEPSADLEDNLAASAVSGRMKLLGMVTDPQKAFGGA
jgi:hypothetical protein